MDFGLAKATVMGSAEVSNAPLLSATATMRESPLTAAGQVIGTIQYMSPEQIAGKQADARSDLFALGAVLYEMSTGKRPFDGKTQISVAHAILENDPEPISTSQPLTPPVFEHVVGACLAKNPDDRFQTAREVRLELKWTAEGASRLTAKATAPARKTARGVLPWAIAIAAPVLVGAFFLTRPTKPKVRYTNVTFREGTLQAARFSRDGQTIVYSGAWEGEPPQLGAARVGSPESRALGLPSGAIAAISSSDELAVLLGCELVFTTDCAGTLATVSLAGGSPRNLAEHIAYADWSPDGKQLAVSVYSSEGARLEFPPGHVLYRQKTGWFGHPRFAPDGKMIAYENHPVIGNDDGAVELLDLDGKRKVLAQGWLSLEGLSWSPAGKEIWFAATEEATTTTGQADTIYAVSLSGEQRIVVALPDVVRLHDISRDGRVLLSHESWRLQMKGLFPGNAAEHPYSWLDSTNGTAISDDGRSISFYESQESYYLKHDWLTYYRRTDGSPAVQLGGGKATLSPDGKLVVLAGDTKLLLQPIGPGEPRSLPAPGLVDFDRIAWSGDGRLIAYEAQNSQKDWNVYKQRADGGPPILVKSGGRNTYPVLSPDGGTVAVREQRGGISLYRADGGQQVLVKGVHESERPIRFARDGKWLLVVEPTGRELVLTLVELASGRRELWKRFASDASTNELVAVTPDLRYYTYVYPRNSSHLYLVDNLR